ncbi:MAG: 5'-3' exonuclease H3TH domain-containing protein, partial [Candidatus Ratteibacteria bacterium]
MKKIYLIDGSGIVYRSFYAIPELKTSTGFITNAIYGFTSTLLKILKEKKPEYIAVFFDIPVPTFRHKTFEKYKEKRKPMPDELKGQITKIKEIINYLGIKYMEKEGYEADDLIGSFVEKNKKKGCEIFIIGCDKDILQLIDDNVYVINPVNYEIIDKNYIIKKYGFPPEKIVDFIALSGDASDNIPGIPGIGEKTAISLLSKFNSIEDIYNNLEKIDSEKLREKLKKNKEIAFISKELAKLNKEIFDEIDLEEIRIKVPQLHKLFELFELFEFRKLKETLKELFPEVESFQDIENLIGFSTGEIVRYNEILENTAKYREILDDKSIGKIGFNLKDKIVALYKKGIELKNIEFDFSI